MGRPRKYESPAERQKAYLERQSKGETNTPAEKPAPVAVSPDPELEAELTEQQLRDQFGYSPSESRTRAERDLAASRMLSRPSHFPSEEEYVAGEVAQTRVYAKTMLRPLVKSSQDPSDVVDKTSPEAVAARLLRAEKYARWRYQGYLAGEIASL